MKKITLVLLALMLTPMLAPGARGELPPTRNAPALDAPDDRPEGDASGG